MKHQGRSGKLTLSLALGTVVMATAVGCDDASPTSDAEAARITAAVIQTNASAPADYDAALARLNEAETAAVSAAARADVRAARGHLALQRSVPVIDELMDVAAEARVAMAEAQGLTRRIAGLARQIAAIEAQEPTQFKQAYQDIKGQARGDNNRQAWIETASGEIPTLEQTQQTISSIESQIEQIDTSLQQKRQAAAEANRQAQQALADARTAGNAEAVELLKTAREQSVNAQELDSQIAADETELQRLAGELAVNRTRQEQLRAYLASLDDSVTRLDATWSELSQQVQGLRSQVQADARRLQQLMGDGTSASASESASSESASSEGASPTTDVSGLLARAAELRSEATGLLGTAVSSFREAASSAQTFRQEVSSREAGVGQAQQQQIQGILKNTAPESYLLRAGESGGHLAAVHLDEVTLLEARQQLLAAADDVMSRAGVQARFAEGAGLGGLDPAITAADAALAGAQADLDKARLTNDQGVSRLAKRALAEVLRERLRLFEIAEAYNAQNVLALEGRLPAEVREEIQVLLQDVAEEADAGGTGQTAQPAGRGGR